VYSIVNPSSDSASARTLPLLVTLLLAGICCPASAQSIPQSPVPAEQTLQHFVLHPDCRIELVAAEPDVIDPVSIAFSPDGKLWVVEYSDYPNGPPENGPPLSRIRTLTDDDGDGRYTNPVTFADKLLFANTLMLWQDGVIVTSDGAVTFMRDVDGDGKADEKTDWFRGFAKDNPQLRANHPTLGLDGHIYVASGLRGGEVIATRTDWPASPKPTAPPSDDCSPAPDTAPTDGKAVGLGTEPAPKPVSLSGRDFRFDPFTGKYEVVSGPGQFGLCFDPFGNRFVCSNRNPNNHIVLEDRYLARNPHLAVSKVFHEVSPAAENSKLFPISRTWTTSNLHANQFTAACGVLIYGGDALPQFDGNSFICEPTANLVHRDVLEPMGATFTSHYGREGVEFLATRDEWFRPVNLTHGPDGALYVVDMYRAVIEHPQFMPDELKTRPDLTLGNDRGRIYRIVNKEPVERQHDSSFHTEPELLVEHLKSPNAWHRETAFRLLLEHRHPASTLQQDRVLEKHNERIDQTVRDIAAAKISSPEVRAAAFALLRAVNENQNRPGHTWGAIKDPDPRVAALGLRLAEPLSEDERGLDDFRDRLVEILEDETSDSQLAFQAALSIGNVEPHRTVTAALADAAGRYADDQWFRAAIVSSASGKEAEIAAPVLEQFRRKLERQQDQQVAPPLELVQTLAGIVGGRGDVDGSAALLQALLTPPQSTSEHARSPWRRTQFAVLGSLNDGLRRGKSSLDDALVRLTAEERQEIAGIFSQARSVAQDAGLPETQRREGITLAAIDSSQAASDLLQNLVTRETDQSVLTAAISALGRKPDEQVADVLLDGFRSRTPSVRSAILSALLARADRTHRLLDEIEAGNLSPRDIDAASATRLTKSRDAKINERAAKLLASTADADRAKVIAQYETCLQQAGDPQRGLELFKKTCATCHQMGEIGTNVGPDISDSRTKTPEFLLTNILDPNRAVDGNYFGYTILDVEGRVHTGIITSETASSVTLRMPEGKDLTLLRSDIEEMVNTGQSLMPVGLEKDITPEQMADLISFIKNWRYLDGSVPQEVIR
jgi:putative membrane-bound dehydrogenase-like protein